MRVRKGNKATIRVNYPDGCRQQWVTHDNIPLARSAVKFAAWLHEIADQIHEAATTEGHHVKKEKVDD